jgi:RNA polymerase sigma-70 factor (ECF subfamily)
MDFEEMVRNYSRRIYRMAYWMVGNKEDAEDITQDVFLIAYRKFHTFRGEADIYTWLYRIGIHCALRFRRKRRDILSLEDVDNISDNTGISIEERTAVKKAVLSLPVKLREVVVLHYFEGFRYEEITGILHIPIGTVKSRLARAKERLKVYLRGLYEEG